MLKMRKTVVSQLHAFKGRNQRPSYV